MKYSQTNAKVFKFKDYVYKLQNNLPKKGSSLHNTVMRHIMQAQMLLASEPLGAVSAFPGFFPSVDHVMPQGVVADKRHITAHFTEINGPPFQIHSLPNSRFPACHRGLKGQLSNTEDEYKEA